MAQRQRIIIDFDWFFYFLIIAAILAFSGESKAATGDLIFIKAQTSQTKALQDATGSDWTHVGVVVGDKVAESVDGVKLTPIKKFISKSKNGQHQIYRSAKYHSSMDEDLAGLVLQLKSVPYDIYFEWSDEKLYCSEFVYKVFKELTGEGVGELQQMKDMNLKAPSVQALIKKRYQDTGRVFDPNEIIITPVSQMRDPALKLIQSNIRGD